MSSIKDLVIPFIIAGTTVSLVKYTAIHLDNQALAAILGGVPIGLLSIYFLTEEKTIGYSQNYFFVCLSLLTAILVFYLLSVYTNMTKNTILVIALIVWATLVSIRYVISHRQ